jgi:hypothetical protein
VATGAGPYDDGFVISRSPLEISSFIALTAAVRLQWRSAPIALPDTIKFPFILGLYARLKWK